MAINYRTYYLRYNRYFRQLTDAYSKTPVLRASLELLLTLFAISFFSLFALRPTINTIAGLWASINSQKEIKGGLEQKIRGLSTAQEIWRVEQKRIELVEQALPENPNPDIYIRQIESLAATSGLLINFLSVDEVTLRGETQIQGQEKEKAKTPGLEMLGSSLSLSGQYSGLWRFLEDLEGLRRIVRPVSLSFSATQGLTPGQTTLLLTISNEIAYYKGAKR